MSSSLLSHIYSAGLLGIDAFLIDVEMHISLGLPTWNTVGLPESAVRESKDRVISAVHNGGYEFPYRKITINLAPADVKKEGTAYDLPIAIGLLSAAEIIPQERAREYLIVGELSLTGKVRKIRGALSIALLAKERGLKGVILPSENYWEASVVEGIEIHGAANLPQVVEWLTLGTAMPIPEKKPDTENRQDTEIQDFGDVRGQAYAKRAMEVAAAGFHNILLVGPPGTGKTMLASRLPSILAPMSFEEALTTTKIYSLMGLIPKGASLLRDRPFRSPHHSISDAGLIGGGTHPKPGEVSLAHHGILFLDELTEFQRHVLESLRQPIEEGRVTISRAAQSMTYPSRFLLVAAMNPCPCGHYGNPLKNCQCNPMQLQRYQNRLSGPLLDRIDLKVEVPAIRFEELTSTRTEEGSEAIRSRVIAAQDRQKERLKPYKLHFNSQMSGRQIAATCKLSEAGQKIMEMAMNKWQLSARSFNRLLKVARTVGDLKQEEEISTESLTEAVQYRMGEMK